jgi:hypothetical protein
MTNKLLKLFISDIKYILRVPALLFALLWPVIITLFLLYLYPVISGLVRSEAVPSYGRYYTVTAITLIASVPFIYGLLFSFTHMKESHSPGNNIPDTAKKDAGRNLIMRMLYSAFLNFITVLPAVYLTDAVSTEGWLRSIYAAILLTVMTSFIYLFATCIARVIENLKIAILVSAILLVTVPAGLLLHHPWNYFIFFSPFYWVSWAWVIPSPAESLTYGIISLLIAAASMLIFYRYYSRE